MIFQQRPLGRVKNQMRGHQQEIWYKIWILRQWGNWWWVLNGSFWSEETLAGLYCLIVSIVLYWLDRIVSSGLYRIGWIVSYQLYRFRKHWILCADWLLAGWDGWTGWRVGGTGMGRTDISTRWNGSATIGSWGAVGCGKWWLAPIASVLQGRGVFVLVQKNNTNILHTNRN